MKAYKGTFTKKDGSLREMSFVKLEDILNYNSEFLSDRIKGGNKSNTLSEGMELVFDLEADNFRVFNWNKSSNVTEYTIDDGLFL